MPSVISHSGLLTVCCRSERAKTEALKNESKELDAKFEEVMRGELQSLKDAVAKSNADSEQAAATAQYVTKVYPAPLLIDALESFPRNLPACVDCCEQLVGHQWTHRQRIRRLAIPTSIVSRTFTLFDEYFTHFRLALHLSISPLSLCLFVLSDSLTCTRVYFFASK
jgi:hypothetical protein